MRSTVVTAQSTDLFALNFPNVLAVNRGAATIPIPRRTGKAAGVVQRVWGYSSENHLCRYCEQSMKKPSETLSAVRYCIAQVIPAFGRLRFN